MGHCSQIFKGTNKAELERKAIEFGEYEHDRFEGGNPIDGVRWTNMQFNSYEEAKEYFYSHDYSWGATGFTFKEVDIEKKSAKLIKLEERLKNAKKTYQEFASYVPHRDMKSNFIACKTCGAKIPTQRYNENYCPFCRQDLRSNTNLVKLQRYKEIMETLQREYEKEYKAEYMKKIDKAKIYYGVFVDVHC